MTVRADENLSAFVDGELGAGDWRPLLATLTTDDELRERWQRYHLIGEALRRGLPDRIDPDLVSRLHRQLEAEPTVLAPRRLPWRAMQPYLRQAASLAIAAGVAVAAVLLAPQLMRSEPAVEPAQQVAQVAPPPEMNADVMRASMSPSGIQHRGVDQRLDEFLVNHYEHSAITRVQGVLPYVRIVGHSRISEQ